MSGQARRLHCQRFTGVLGSIGAGLLGLVLTLSGPAKAETFDAVLTRWIDALETQAAATESKGAAPAVKISEGGSLRRGSSSPRVLLLTQRLRELNLLADEDVTADFTDKVQAAVEAFQTANGMRPDGVVGLGTVSALNRSPAEAAAEMRRSAADMQALKAENIRDMLFVNLPSQRVFVVRNGELALSMRAIVGRPSRETPLLRDRITHVIVNPTWTVPPTVMKEDKLPNLRRTGKPGISNATIYLDGEEVADPAVVDWTDVSPERVRIVQQPGNHNALGRFRFNLTNPFSIYLHGTNEPYLFDRELRTISSGCVRLQEARQLAEMLLNENGISNDQINRLMATGTPQWVKLNRALPVRFTYWMATQEDDGLVHVHPNIYDRTEEKAAGARRGSTATSTHANAG